MSYPYYAPAPAPMAGETPQGQAIKKSLGSAIFLMAVISNTLMVVLSLATVLFGSDMVINSVINMIAQASNAVGVYPNFGEVYEVLDQVMPFIKVTSVISMIPSMVMCLGLWLTYTGARKKTPVKGTAGLTILQVFAILALVGLCLSALLVIIIMIPSIAGSGMLDEYLEMRGAATGLVIGIFVIIIAVLVFEIVYYAKLNGLYSGAKALSRNERVRKKASVFVIVIAFIIVVGNLINLITTAISVLSLSRYLRGMAGAMQYITLATSIFQFFYGLFLAITYIKLRSAEEPFTHALQNPAAPNYVPYEPVAGTAPKPYGTYDMYNQPQQPQQVQPMATPYPMYPQGGMPQAQPQAPYMPNPGMPNYQAPSYPQYQQPQNMGYAVPPMAPATEAPATPAPSAAEAPSVDQTTTNPIPVVEAPAEPETPEGME